MTMSIDEIISLNNHGCDFLAQGDDTSAADNFKTALTFLKRYLNSRPEQKRDESHPECSQLNTFPVQMLRKVISAANPNSQLDAARSQNLLYIHSNTIRMMPGFTFMNDPIEDSKIQTALIVFNLAITLHMQGMSKCSRKSLEKAQSLYSYTYQLIGPIVNDHYKRCCPTENAAFDVLVLGMLNNVAHINMEFSEFESASSVSQSLAQYATLSSYFARDVYPSEQRQGTQEDSSQMAASIIEEIDNMVMNASVMGLQSNSVAPAA